MAQGGFAFFFLSVLVGCSIAVALWVRTNWEKIAVAVRGEGPRAEIRRYRAAQCRPMDVPYVAQRMLGEPVTSEARSVRRPAWTAGTRRPAGYQLAFGF